MMRLFICAPIVIAILIASRSLSAQPGTAPVDDHPIIAHLYSEPDAYAGRSVVIYGLVVETTDSSFMLQDVSQRPLKIVGDDKIKAVVGDEVIVVGIFHSGPVAPYIAAQHLIATQVLAGGGCC